MYVLAKAFFVQINPSRVGDSSSDIFLVQSSIGKPLRVYCARLISTILVKLFGYSLLQLTGKNSSYCSSLLLAIDRLKVS